MSNETIDFLRKCDEAYHNGLPLIVSDYEYDRLKTKARAIFPEDPYFKTVGATPTGDKVDLPYILGSLEKVKYDGTLNQWIKDNRIEHISVSDKLDGCTIYVEYRNGEVYRAMTRGDGYQGRDITAKAKVFCPKCADKGEWHLKGEVLSTFEKAHDLGYKKARTFVAGVLNRDDMENVDALEVVFYRVLNKSYKTYADHIASICAIDLPFVIYSLYHIKDIENVEDFLAEYYQTRKESSRFGIDGLVVTNHYDADAQDEYYPTNEVAFKVNEDAVHATVRSVEWEVKRTGKLMPVVHIGPVDIAGSTVTKATGFNMAFIRDNEIGNGSEIGIVLSGEIIPYITETFCPSGEVTIPKTCPSCRARLGVSATGIDLLCFNQDCEGKMLYRLENFLLSNGVEEISATTIQNLGIKSFDELLNLDEWDISNMEGFGISRASQIVAQVNKIYKTTPANLLKSFGVTGVGSTMSKMIVGHFDDFEGIFDANLDDFMTIEGIGPIVADNLVRELPQYKVLYENLKKGGLNFTKKGISLKGLKITLTGASEVKRNDLIRMIEEQGGMVKGISKGVDYLFTNSPTSTTTKMKKAIEYGIQIHGYDKLYEMLGITV